MMDNILLNPNCSEVCWRLDLTDAVNTKEKICNALNPIKVNDDDYDCHSDSDSLMNTFKSMLHIIKEGEKEGLITDINGIRLETKDINSTYSLEAVELCFDSVIKYLNNKTTKEEIAKGFKTYSVNEGEDE